MDTSLPASIQTDNSSDLRVAYILKMYPRFSETFIVNEILAHEAAGTTVEIFSLRAPVDGRFHAQYAQVKAQVTYVPENTHKVSAFWPMLQAGLRAFPDAAHMIQELDVDAGDLAQAIYIARAVQASGAQVLHAHFATIATTVAQLVSRLTGIPFVFTAHAKDIFHESVDPADLAAKLRAAHAVITVSDFNVDFLHAHYASAQPELQRIYNGLDLSRFPYSAPDSRPPLILGVGRLIEKKGFHVLIEACAILAQKGIAFTCDIVGSGQLSAQLAQQIQQLDLAHKVFLRGAEPQADVIRRLHTSAVFAAPCVVGGDGNRDGLPTVLLEAMAVGTSCVSTDVTGIPEILHHDLTGLQVAQGDASSLAQALERLLVDPQLRRQMADAARARIERDFDIHNNSARIRDLYRRLASHAASGLAANAAQPPTPVHAHATVKEIA